MSISPTFNGHSDEQLFALYLDEQNQAAFTELYERHAKSLNSWIDTRCLFENGSSEDVVQNTFTAIHVNKDSYDRTKPFLPWLRRIATHEAINYGVKSRRKKRVGDTPTLSISHRLDTDTTWGTTSDPAGRSEKLSCAVLDANGETDTIELLPEQVYECLNVLSDEQRQAIVLTIYDGLSERDAARELGVSRHAIRTLISDGLKLAHAALSKVSAA